MTHNDQFKIMLEKHVHDSDGTGTVSKDTQMHQGKTSWVSHR